MSNPTDLHLANPDGYDFSCVMALPDGDGKAPAVIVIQEIFGLNADVRQKCADWADKGYVAIAPDLFWRQQPGVQLTDKSEAEWARAFELLRGFNLDKGIFDLTVTLDFIRAHDRCNGHVGAVGYCLGGKLAYLMAARTDIDASVCYYGVDLVRFMPEAINIKKPHLMHIAQGDKFVSPDDQAKMHAMLDKCTNVTVHDYAGVNHAFSRVNGEHYDAGAATLANARTADFIQQNLG